MQGKKIEKIIFDQIRVDVRRLDWTRFRSYRAACRFMAKRHRLRWSVIFKHFRKEMPDPPREVPGMLAVSRMDRRLLRYVRRKSAATVILGVRFYNVSELMEWKRKYDGRDLGLFRKK